MSAMLTEEGERRRVDEARAWLSRVRSLVGYQATLERTARDRLERADGLRAIDYSKPNVSSSPYADAIPDAIAANEAIGELLSSLSDAARDDIAKAAAAVASLGDPLEARCLHLYYIDAVKTWEAVCVEMDYSYDGMMKLSRRALLHIYEVMPHVERTRMPPAL